MATQILAEEPNSPLDLLSIQGDILIGLQKDAERFIFFEIADVDAFRLALRELFPLVTSAAVAAEREQMLDLAKAAGSHERLALLGLNLGFTYGGLGKLLDETGFADGIADFDPSFKAGAVARAGALGDDVGLWLPAFADGAIDGVFLVTAPSEDEAEDHAATVLATAGGAITLLHSEMGATRPQRGHEHFGFLDGVSQPGIRGLTEPVNPVDPEQGLPGQDLIHAGEFVFGYPGQVDPFKVGRPATKEEEGDIVAPPFDWMANGSFMVFRRLEQKVIAFHDFVETQAFALGTDPALLSARMVGRWPSGAPVERAPLQDDVGLAADRLSNNDFEFGEDLFQRRCPYAAHIRKAYPRDDLNDSGPALLAGESGEASVQTHRLRRAGIPFGPEVGEDEVIGSEASRGLMFVCYQTSLVEQFEFVQKDWCNNVNFVIGKLRPGAGGALVAPGHDPIIGQAAGPRQMDEPLPNYPTGSTRSSLVMPEPFVVATGAAYFFMPSLDALRVGPLVGC